jgi:hypothetical protein
MPQFDQLAQTEQYSPPPTPAASSLRDRVALIEASEKDRIDQSLLTNRQRLQMVGWVLLCGFVLFYVRTALNEDGYRRMWALWAFVFFDMGVCLTLLSVWKPLTQRRLQSIELLMFGGAVYFFCALMHFSVIRNAGFNPPLANWIVFSVMLSVTWCCVLAFVYTMISTDSRGVAR